MAWIEDALMPSSSPVTPRLWVGGRPNPFDEHRRFGMIVLCAEEYQPRFPHYQGDVVYAPFADNPEWFPGEDQHVAIEAASYAAEALTDGKRVLVSCWMGWNRSGLVAALALRMTTALDAAEITQLVRNARGPDALSNPQFERFLRRARV